jgi:hypothetical protein
MYLGKETEKPKGDAMVSYDLPIAKAAERWFGGKDFQGSKQKILLSRRSLQGTPCEWGVVQHFMRAEGCHHHSAEVLVVLEGRDQ